MSGFKRLCCCVAFVLCCVGMSAVAAPTSAPSASFRFRKARNARDKELLRLLHQYSANPDNA